MCSVQCVVGGLLCAVCIPLYSSVSHPITDMLASLHLLPPLLPFTTRHRLLSSIILHTTYYTCGILEHFMWILLKYKIISFKVAFKYYSKECAFSKICSKEISSINLRFSQEQVQHRRHMRQVENPPCSRVFHVVSPTRMCI